MKSPKNKPFSYGVHLSFSMQCFKVKENDLTSCRTLDKLCASSNTNTELRELTESV